MTRQETLILFAGGTALGLTLAFVFLGASLPKISFQFLFNAECHDELTFNGQNHVKVCSQPSSSN